MISQTQNLPVTDCTYYITGKSHKKNNGYLNTLYKIVEDALKSQNNISYESNKRSRMWNFEVKDLSSAMQIAGLMMTKHTYLKAREEGVDLYISAKTDDLNLKQCAIKIGERPPTTDNWQTCEEFYLQRYLPDHSLEKTRLIHTAATVVGISSAIFGIFQLNPWWFFGGIGLIYESGFHSHLFVEKNTPSSAEGLQDAFYSVYGDFRVTWKTLFGGMEDDLKKAGIKRDFSEAD